MSFYRSLLAAVAAVVIAAPVFAEEATATQGATTGTGTEANQAVQVSENAGAATEGKTADASEQCKVNLNKATVKELVKVKGLNASKAKAIVAYRKKHGDFKSTDELANVKGFKKLKPDALKEIADQFSVE